MNFDHIVKGFCFRHFFLVSLICLFHFSFLFYTFLFSLCGNISFIWLRVWLAIVVGEGEYCQQNGHQIGPIFWPSWVERGGGGVTKGKLQ